MRSCALEIVLRISVISRCKSILKRGQGYSHVSITMILHEGSLNMVHLIVGRVVLLLSS